MNRSIESSGDDDIGFKEQLYKWFNFMMSFLLNPFLWPTTWTCASTWNKWKKGRILIFLLMFHNFYWIGCIWIHNPLGLTLVTSEWIPLSNRFHFSKQYFLNELHILSFKILLNFDPDFRFWKYYPLPPPAMF